MKQAISLRELAFVRDILIPRAWVQGAEVDELVNLRARIDSIFAGLTPATATEQSEAPPRTKKPRHPKKGGKPIPPEGEDASC